MHSIRNLIFLCGGGALAAYFCYDYWLRAFIEQVPQYVFELSFWTWTLWSGWYLLQKISR
jgi:hypothetical protein